ncbi:ABC transporter permease [Streptacidiphilus sp. P02-A3a]|uniref:ABC transporter permease n=1 Tax=Streptacidiphilus sp. P02-A3a TaxID=2704468 RepID=UPI00351A07BE
MASALEDPTVASGNGRARKRTDRSRPRLGRTAILLISGLYFVGPLAGSFMFTVDDPVKGFTLSAYSQIFSVSGLWPSLQLSLLLAVATIALVFLLLIPTVIAVRLGSPRLRSVVEFVCMLPLVVPSIALTAGINILLRWGSDNLASTPFWDTLLAVQNASFPVVLLLAYVVMALPLAFRTLDAGMRALDVRTLLEAAQNNGANRTRAIFFVVLPNLRGAMLNAGMLTLALVLGEFTVSSILGYTPFAVWIVNGNVAGDGTVTTAVSLVSMVLTWAVLLILSVTGGRRSAAAKPA